MKRPVPPIHVSAAVFLFIPLQMLLLLLISIFNWGFIISNYFSFSPLHLMNGSHTVPGGLTLREGTRIIDRVFQSGRLCGLDIVEVCPKIGNDKDVKTTVDSAVHLITATMGNQRSGNLPSSAIDLPRN